jgi:peptidoglycan/LPS O-acetylase OafA/YrhL
VGACVPFLGAILRSGRWSWTFWILTIIAIKLLGFSTFLFEFSLGAFLFYHWKKITSRWIELSSFLKALVAIFAATLYTCLFQFGSLFSLNHTWIRPGLDRLLVGLGCALFFAVIISSKKTQRILSIPLLVKMGRCCYSIYLTHMIFIICFEDYLISKLHQLFSLSEQGYFAAFCFIYLILVILCSWATFQFIEAPFNRLGKRIGLCVEASFSGSSIHQRFRRSKPLE